ncbi:very short patch repair endonuclease [Curtobacterium sp. MCBD17_028]|uniref:very short patch repair endonuclease n=1 Tax=Curtobacterium sp. MCBD17_028 TaxID=2175670 RepID=UPI000DA98EDA|nr:very short patch repair endonuclease [Curtobacterium sp. MCBD17_028]PZE26111.1 very short patch repair endonuclease [Curtobacterium sp. MCBD17_028]
MPVDYGGDSSPVDGDTPAADSLPSAATRRSMQGNRSRDTRPELGVRRLLHAAGLRYRVAHRPLPNLRRTADILFTRARVAVFIDGCYWHRCPEHASTPRTRTEFWVEKFDRNVARDAETTAALEASGWLVLRFWEHENPASVANEVERIVTARKRARSRLEPR